MCFGKIKVRLDCIFTTNCSRIRLWPDHEKFLYRVSVQVFWSDCCVHICTKDSDKRGKQTFSAAINKRVRVGVSCYDAYFVSLNWPEVRAEDSVASVCVSTCRQLLTDALLLKFALCLLSGCLILPVGDHWAVSELCFSWIFIPDSAHS